MSLVAHWKLNDNAATTTVLDALGNNNGTFVDPGGNPVTSAHHVAGKVGTGALIFDGSDDYVIRNPFNSFPTTEITATFWMKSSDITKQGTPFSYAISAQANEFLIFDYRSFTIYIKGGNVPTGVSANDGSWRHIVVTWRGSDGQTKLYKDVVQAYSGTLASGNTIISGGSLVIAQEQDQVGGGFDSGQAFLGTIDDVRIYNHVLSTSEITALYNNGIGIDNSYIYYFKPSYIYEEDISHRTGILNKEDGGEQRNSYGEARRVFILNYDRITEAKRDLILAFYDARYGKYEAFGWVNPNDNTEYTVRFIEDSLTWQESEYQLYNMKVSLIEVL